MSPFRTLIMAMLGFGLITAALLADIEQQQDPQSLFREEIVSDFLQTAFSSVAWMPNDAQKKDAGFLSPDHSSAQYWLGLVKGDALWAAQPTAGKDLWLTDLFLRGRIFYPSILHRG